MRAYGNLEFVCHQDNGQNILNTGQSCRIDLTILNRVLHEQLLENNRGGDLLSSSNPNSKGSEAIRNTFITEDIIPRGGLFDPIGTEL